MESLLDGNDVPVILLDRTEMDAVETPDAGTLAEPVRPLRVLFLVSAHNGLSQRALIALSELGHEVTVAVVDRVEPMEAAVDEHDPELIGLPLRLAGWPSVWSAEVTSPLGLTLNAVVAAATRRSSRCRPTETWNSPARMSASSALIAVTTRPGDGSSTSSAPSALRTIRPGRAASRSHQALREPRARLVRPRALSRRARRARAHRELPTGRR
jgi:hypothetical protein